MTQTYEARQGSDWGPEAEAVNKKVQSALKRGRGIAVVPVDALLIGDEEFDLTGLPEERRKLEITFHYRAGRMGVEFFPGVLPSATGESLVIYRASPLDGTPEPIAALLDALKDMSRAPGSGATQTRDAAETAAEAVRAMLPTSRSKRK